ncbi:MAG TPA: addiction module protein [Vicinamibacterales bacterium]|jgi:putative addiction module component (TIGR02574 family)|nr:addiction module protein [Vicinamibacterales bacterium]
MSNPVPLPPPGFDDLSVDEQIEYVQTLWDRIAATPEQVPVPNWHREILDERLKDYEKTPNAGESWDVVREQLRDKLSGNRTGRRDPRRPASEARSADLARTRKALRILFKHRTALHSGSYRTLPAQRDR